MSEQLLDNNDFKDLTIRDYARLFDLPEPTVRSRIRLQKLKTVDVELDGRIQKAIRVKNNDLPTDNTPPANDSLSSLKIINPAFEKPSTDYHMIIGDRDERIKELKETIIELESDNQLKSKLMDSLRDEITELRESLAGVRGELKGKDELIRTKDEVIQAKEQAVNAANAAVMLLESHKLPAIETKDNSQHQTYSSNETKKGWFDKILGR
jgi:hypothetical protein